MPTRLRKLPSSQEKTIERPYRGRAVLVFILACTANVNVLFFLCGYRSVLFVQRIRRRSTGKLVIGSLVVVTAYLVSLDQRRPPDTHDFGDILHSRNKMNERNVTVDVSAAKKFE